MEMYNKKFDGKLPILTALYEYADGNKGVIEDHVFTEACETYERDEESVMEEMMETKEYKFDRMPDGFIVLLT